MAGAREANARAQSAPHPHRGAAEGAHPVFLFASDSFKGTLSSKRIAQLLTEEARKVFPQAACRSVQIADGGEGTAEAVVSQAGGTMMSTRVQGPMVLSVEARYGLLPNGSAVLDAASASGLPLVPPAERNPLQASTYGTGQLIRAALDAGARDIAVGLGGTATVDGGMGMLAALGVRFWDNGMWEVPACGGNLEDVARIDVSGLDPRIRECRLRALCDVDNPLLGPQGAARAFGPQKGADPDMVERLEAGMENYAQALQAASGIDVANLPGAGAAGGLGAALVSVLGADPVSGIDYVLDQVGFKKKLKGADYCITGEGRLDSQTLHGKAVGGVAARCKKAGVPCLAVVGSMALDQDVQQLREAGLALVAPTMPDGATQAQIEEDPEARYREAAHRLFANLPGASE
ncbi:MAG: glycerate kinase [Eggerthellaceae bacterium]|jgi:glycerate kinase